VPRVTGFMLRRRLGWWAIFFLRLMVVGFLRVMSKRAWERRGKRGGGGRRERESEPSYHERTRQPETLDTQLQLCPSHFEVRTGKPRIRACFDGSAILLRAQECERQLVSLDLELHLVLSPSLGNSLTGRDNNLDQVVVFFQ